MNRSFLIIALIFCFKTSDGYSQFIEGYIVKNEGDTIKGYLLKETALKNSRDVKFRPELKDEQVTVYTPKDITSYQLGEDSYISYTSTDQTGKSNFLKEVVSGKVSLFESFDDSNDPLFFIKSDGESLTLLPKKTYYGLLKIKLTECSKIRYDELKTKTNIVYTRSSLSDFIAKYNKCVEPERDAIVRKNKKEALKTGIKLGANYNNYEILFPTNEAGKYSGLGGTAGLFFEFPLFSSFSLKAEALYSIKPGEGSKTISFLTVGHYISNYKFSNHFLDIPILVNYNLPGRALQPYINIGPIISAKILTNSKTTYDVSNYSGAHVPDEVIFQKGSTNELSFVSLGLVSSIGLNINSISNKPILVEVRYQYTPLTKDAYRVANLNSISLLIGYRFN